MRPEDFTTEDTEGTEYTNEITHKIIGPAMRVHTPLRPGLLESAYEACLAYEFQQEGLAFEQQKPLPLAYRDVKLDCGYRADFMVQGRVIVEIKSVDTLAPIHAAQLLSYLRLAGCRIGLLINFNVLSLKNGIRRVVNDSPKNSASSAPSAVK